MTLDTMPRMLHGVRHPLDLCQKAGGMIHLPLDFASQTERTDSACSKRTLSLVHPGRVYPREIRATVRSDLEGLREVQVSLQGIIGVLTPIFISLVYVHIPFRTRIHAVYYSRNRRSDDGVSILSSTSVRKPILVEDSAHVASFVILFVVFVPSSVRACNSLEER